MTEERCEPHIELRGVDGWHHVNVAGIERPVWWTASAIIPPNADYMEFAPAWIAPGGGRVGPLVAYHRKWRYIAPVATPAEVDALRAEVDRLRELFALPNHVSAQRIHHLQTSLKFLAGIARSFGFANRKQEMNEQFIGRVLREQAARVAELESAIAELIGPYTGGADNTLDDPYIMDRARAALEGKP